MFAALDLQMISLRIISILFCIAFFSACSNKTYPDLSHYSLHQFKNEIACTSDRQCKVVGYGIGSSCGPTYDGGVAGYLIYSNKIGSKNIRYLKKLAAESRKDTNSGRNNFFQMSEEILEECLPIHYYTPKPVCFNNECRWR